MLYNPRHGVRGDELVINREFDEDIFECLLDALLAQAEADKWDHKDLWIDGIQKLTKNDDYRKALEWHCEENLLFWNSEEFCA